jgi:rubredoxin
MLPPDIGCPRCGFLFKTSSVFCALPALTRCPVCGLTIDELRFALEVPGPRPRLESDLQQLERRPSQRPSASLEAHLGGATSGDLQKPLERGTLDWRPGKHAA